MRSYLELKLLEFNYRKTELLKTPFKNFTGAKYYPINPNPFPIIRHPSYYSI